MHVLNKRHFYARMHPETPHFIWVRLWENCDMYVDVFYCFSGQKLWQINKIETWYNNLRIFFIWVLRACIFDTKDFFAVSGLMFASFFETDFHFGLSF
jgi:hypothetical protein